MLRIIGLNAQRLTRLSITPTLQVIKETDLIEAIQSQINCVKIDVQDISDGCGSNFAIDIVSDDFKGKRAVNRQRMVNKAIKPYLEEIHQLRVFTNTTEEAEKEWINKFI